MNRVDAPIWLKRVHLFTALILTMAVAGCGGENGATAVVMPELITTAAATEMPVAEPGELPLEAREEVLGAVRTCNTLLVQDNDPNHSYCLTRVNIGGDKYAWAGAVKPKTCRIGEVITAHGYSSEGNGDAPPLVFEGSVANDCSYVFSELPSFDSGMALFIQAGGDRFLGWVNIAEVNGLKYYILEIVEGGDKVPIQESQSG